MDEIWMKWALNCNPSQPLEDQDRSALEDQGFERSCKN
jgi:hypothetical protein